MDDKELWFQMDEESTVGTYKDKIKDALWRIVEDTIFRHSFKCISCWRVMLLKLFGAKIGKRCYISNRAIFVKPWNLVMGNHSSIDDYVFIQNAADITFGNYVSVAKYVKFVTDGHDLTARTFKWIGSPIKIENGVFIGLGSYISKNVKIGQMAAIGANSFVLKDIPENTIAWGNPAMAHKQRLPEEEYMKYKYEE